MPPAMPKVRSTPEPPSPSATPEASLVAVAPLPVLSDPALPWLEEPPGFSEREEPRLLRPSFGLPMP
jgi:hypothetical protein